MAILVLFSTGFEGFEGSEGLYETCIEKIAILDASVPFSRDEFHEKFEALPEIDQIIEDIETST